MVAMNKFQPTFEHGMYALALAAAILLRFLHLDFLPLSDYEANWALQAFQISQGYHPAVGPNPAYVHLTSFLFFLFSGTTWLARFIPALAGTFLCLAPWLLRDRIGRLPALLLAAGLAIDPGSVAMSRLAGGPILAVFFLSSTYLMWINGKRKLAGISAGLAVLSGPSLWFGLLGLVITQLLLFYIPKIRASKNKALSEHAGSSGNGFRPLELRESLLWGLGSLLVVGTLFLISPTGLSASATSLIDFVKGWWVSSNVPTWNLLLALPAYEILPLGFGIAAAVRGLSRRNVTTAFLATWMVIAFLLTLGYPGRETGTLNWMILPAWILAAIELANHFDFAGRNPWELAGVITLLLSLSIFGWLNLASASTIDLALEQARMRLYLVLAVVLLTALSLLLVGAGWSTAIARLGGVWSSVIALSLFTIAMSTGSAGIRQPKTYELWQPEPRPGRLDVLEDVANQISTLNTGVAGQLEITILGINSPQLLWQLRDWQVDQTSHLLPDEKPELIITTANILDLAADYRGEALPLLERPAWESATPSMWLKWFVYRQLPVTRENVILWVRSDLMLNELSQPTP
jgi:hypothetical protein